MSCKCGDNAAWLTCLTFFNGECAYCGTTKHTLHIDHIVPLAQGGQDTPSNIVPACERCSEARDGQDWRDYMMGQGDFNQARMNRIFDWRRICRQAHIEGREC